MEGGETFAEVQERAIRGIIEIVNRERGKSIAIACHMLTIQLIMAKLLQVPIRDVWEMVRLENTSITTMNIEDNGDFEVVRWADDSHLPEELKNANVKVAGIHNTSFDAKYDITDVEGKHHFDGFAIHS
jgi:broad specificity phosphatase PhoE